MRAYLAILLTFETASALLREEAFAVNADGSVDVVGRAATIANEAAFVTLPRGTVVRHTSTIDSGLGASSDSYDDYAGSSSLDSEDYAGSSSLGAGDYAGSSSLGSDDYAGSSSLGDSYSYYYYYYSDSGLGSSASDEAWQAANGYNFKGKYHCANYNGGQGDTGLRIYIDTWPKVARFSFFPLGHNKDGCSGEFWLDGSLNSQTRKWTLKPRQGPEMWIANKCNYVAVELEGTITPDGKTYAGKVKQNGCTDFSTVKEASEFALGTMGTTDCPAGYKRVSTLERCQEAAKASAGIQPSENQDWPGGPNGCQKQKDTHFRWYNNQGTGGGTNPGYTPVCEQATYQAHCTEWGGKVTCNPDGTAADGLSACDTDCRAALPSAHPTPTPVPPAPRVETGFEFYVCGNYCGPTYCKGRWLGESRCLADDGNAVQTVAPSDCADKCCQEHDRCCGGTGDCNTQIAACLERCSQGGQDGTQYGPVRDGTKNAKRCGACQRDAMKELFKSAPGTCSEAFKKNLLDVSPALLTFSERLSRC